MQGLRLPIPLYHGTSTLFLPGILSVGLGGKDPLSELQVHDFIKEIHPLIQDHLGDTDAFRQRQFSWDRMVNQVAGRRNFQHGQTYLTPSVSTAVTYATSKRFGSELLTYSLDFLQLLVDRDVPSVRTTLFRRYPKIFNLLDTSPSPVLIRLDDLTEDELLGEDGGPADSRVARIRKTIEEAPDSAQVLLQQVNFRLKATTQARLHAWLICVTKWHSLQREYNLYELSLAPSQSAA